MFLQVDGVKGDSTDKSHKGWSDVDGYQHGVHLAVDLRGLGTGIPNHDPLLVLKPADSATTFLFDSAAKGKPLPKVRLEVCRANAGKAGLQCFLWIELTEANVASYVQNDSEETLTFNYGAIEWRYTPYLRTGAASPPISVKWDTRTRDLTSSGSIASGAAIGYGAGDGKSFLLLKGPNNIFGEVTVKGFERSIGLSGFTHTLTGTQVVKGTDVATPSLLMVLHQGGVLTSALTHFGCQTIKGAFGCASSFEDARSFLTDLTYGASQVEHVGWVFAKENLPE
jgi:type VI secretion system secreted protein Hcp